MVEINFGPIQESTDLPLVPPGAYLVEVKEVRARTNNEGSEMWGLRLVVAEGEYKGTTAAWDNLVWSPKGIGRIKRVLRLMGFPVDGKLRVEPEDLLGKRVLARVILDKFKDPATGRERERNQVPFGGYLEPGEKEENKINHEEIPPGPLPF